MQEDTAASRNIKLIATDLDGTLIGSANEFPLYSLFRDRVNELRRHNNAVWVACTGRSLHSFWDFFSSMRTMGLMPDFVVIRHAFIYGLTRFGYLPHIFWNLHIHYQQWSTQFYVRHAIDEWHRMITGGTLGVKTLRREKNRLCLQFNSEESAVVAADMLRERVKPYRHLKVFKYYHEVDVKAVPFTKGLALRELSEHLGLKPQNVLAIGNGHNDISMLERGVARYTGCPSNSEAEVIETVHESGGHVAAGRTLSGVMEILEATLKDTVSSDLPEGWVPPAQSPNPDSRRHHKQNNPRLVRRRTKWILGGMVYAVLVVFASFEIIPGSEIITKPFALMAIVVEKILSLLYR